MQEITHELARIATALEQLLALQQQAHSAATAAAAAPVPQAVAPSLVKALEPLAAPAEPPVAAPCRDYTLLEQFLNSRNIHIKTMPVEGPSDTIIDSVAQFMGERYSAIGPTLRKIKRAMATGATFSENLKNRSQIDVSSICQLGTRLHELAFLEAYHYRRSPHFQLNAKTTTLPRAQNFFSGQWLERFVLKTVQGLQCQLSAKQGAEVPFQYLINPQISLSNGDDFELDLLFSLDGEVYWIEAKSGDYQQHVSKYSNFARELGLSPSRAFMVLTDITEARCHELSSLFMMTVCNLDMLPGQLRAAFAESLGQAAVPLSASSL